jgi:pimeloyl-ACP methyl ester carboxylesterase
MGVSMGGLLTAQAATKEHRIKALVVNPGVIDWSANMEAFLDQLDPSLRPLLETDEDAFNAQIYKMAHTNPLLAWGMPDTMWHHGVANPAALVRELQKYRLGENIRDITAHTLVVDAEAEAYGASNPFFEALTSRKDYLLFTAVETAQFHVQPGASAIATHRLLEWLERVL